MHIKRFFLALLAASVLISGIGALPAQAKVSGYGKTAASVAKKIKCKNQRLKSGAGEYTKSSLVCDLKGKRVNVITFKSENQQIDWLANVPFAFVDTAYVAVGRGVVIIAKSGSKSAAKVGAKAVDGAVVPIRSAW